MSDGRMLPITQIERMIPMSNTTKQERRFIRQSLINEILQEQAKLYRDDCVSLYHIITVVRCIELAKYGQSMSVYGRTIRHIQ